MGLRQDVRYLPNEVIRQSPRIFIECHRIWRTELSRGHHQTFWPTVSGPIPLDRIHLIIKETLNPHALAGVKVLDISHVQTDASCTQLLEADAETAVEVSRAERGTYLNVGNPSNFAIAQLA